jgi:hypothetical protein
VSERSYEGGCLCGATRYRVSGPARNECFCHCRSCRLAAGAPAVAWATFARTGFQVVRGSLAHFRSSPRVERGFCPSCGTAISYAHDARADELDVTLASLDDPGALRPKAHIWVSHRIAWMRPGDGLPEFAEWRADPD